MFSRYFACRSPQWTAPSLILSPRQNISGGFIIGIKRLVIVIDHWCFCMWLFIASFFFHPGLWKSYFSLQEIIYELHIVFKQSEQTLADVIHQSKLPLRVKHRTKSVPFGHLLAVQTVVCVGKTVDHRYQQPDLHILVMASDRSVSTITVSWIYQHYTRWLAARFLLLASGLVRMSGASGQGGRDDQQPFSLPWVNSCYQQTLLPDAPWHRVSV